MGQNKSKPVRMASPQERDWATRHGFEQEEFDAMMKLIHANQVNEKMFQSSANQIAEGEFGAVMLGTYQGQQVAVKHINDKSAGQGGGYPALFRTIVLELSIISGLKHPNVVEFKGCTLYMPGAAEDQKRFQLGMIFEMCADSLWSTMHRKFTKFSFEDKIRIMKEIAQGASYLHERQIVHRDLSSSNILVSSNYTAKIADFGFARKCTNGTYDSKTIAGTPGYMSTEQVAGRLLSTKTDVWALGCLFWELLTEKGSSNFPWNTKDPQRRGEYAMKVATDKATLQRDARIPPGFLDGIVDALSGAFQSEPGRRLSSSQLLGRLNTLSQPRTKGAGQENVQPNVQQQQQRNGNGAIKPLGGAMQQGGVRVQPMAAAGAPPPQARTPEEKTITAMLTQFYSKYNPTKLEDVPYVVRVHAGKMEMLNAKLREQYHSDLSEFQERGGKKKGSGCSIQ